jgi:hypothetical protein
LRHNVFQSAFALRTFARKATTCSSHRFFASSTSVGFGVTGFELFFGAFVCSSGRGKLSLAGRAASIGVEGWSLAIFTGRKVLIFCSTGSFETETVGWLTTGGCWGFARHTAIWSSDWSFARGAGW